MMKETYDLFHITMTHAELEAALGTEAVAKIEEANFVLVPREWRELAFKALRFEAEALKDASGEA